MFFYNDLIPLSGIFQSQTEIIVTQKNKINIIKNLRIIILQNKGDILYNIKKSRDIVDTVCRKEYFGYKRRSIFL